MKQTPILLIIIREDLLTFIYIKTYVKFPDSFYTLHVSFIIWTEYD